MKSHAWKPDEPWTRTDALYAAAYLVACALALGGLLYGLMLTIGVAR